MEKVNHDLNAADEAVKRFESLAESDAEKDFRAKINDIIWKAVGPGLNRVFRRIVEDSKRQRAEQWQAIADARERQERSKNPNWAWNRYMDSIAPKEPPLTPDDARYFWHDEPREKFKLRGWHIFVATCVIILLCSLYVLSCGATLADRCRA